MIERSATVEPTVDPENASHLELLRLLEQHPEYSQRQMAMAMGVSVGKTHYVLKALLNKGWVKAQNFQRSSNKLGYIYRLTPNGLAHRVQLTQNFLVRKEREYLELKTEIASLREELAAGLPQHSSVRDTF
jgi:MarR family transcriptional regulator, temperature-dependent positive regulator of motility